MLLHQIVVKFSIIALCINNFFPFYSYHKCNIYITNTPKITFCVSNNIYNYESQTIIKQLKKHSNCKFTDY